MRPNTVVNFGNVALGSDTIFGVVVYTENGWVPFSEGSFKEQEMVRRMVEGAPLLKCIRGWETMFQR